MESRQLFDAGRSSGARIRLRRSRPLPLAIVSILLPGAGHFFLRQPAIGSALLFAVILAIPAAIALRTLVEPPLAHASWLIGRIAVLSAVFAVWDAPIRALEQAARTRRRGVRPRSAAFLNAMGYGLGHLRMGEKGPGLVAIFAGGGAHVALVLFAPGALRWAAELIPLALAVWGYRFAVAYGHQRAVSTGIGERSLTAPAAKSGSESALPIPSWCVSTTAAVALVWVLATGFAWVTHGLWLAATRIDDRQVVQMEPYYRNPAYGLALEMQAPGWSFRHAPEHVFVLAQHAAEMAQVQLSLRPRLPWFDDPLAAAAAELEALARDGLELTVLEEGETTLAGRLAYRVRGRGIRGRSSLREVELRLLGSGHRRYVLRMEWDPEHADFARSELRGLLAALQIEGTSAESVTTAR